MTRILFLLAVAAAVLAGGCSHPPPPRPVPLTVNQHFHDHAGTLKNEVSGLGMTGVFLSVRTYEDFRYSPEELVRRLQEAGITQVYLMSENYEVKDFGGELGGFLGTLKKAGIPAWLVISDHVTYEKTQESFARLNTLAYDYDKHFFRRISEFSAVENALGIALVLTPHLKSHLRSRGLYSWNDTTYGIGGDNDHLLKQSLKLVSDIRRQFRSKPLSLVIPAFYHARAAAGELSVGKITDFLPLADQLVVTAEGEEAGLGTLRPQLAEAASLGRQLVVCLSAGNHFSGRRFNPSGEETFAGFMSRLSTGLNNIRNVPGFGGIALLDFRGLEVLLEKPE